MSIWKKIWIILCNAYNEDVEPKPKPSFNYGRVMSNNWNNSHEERIVPSGETVDILCSRVWDTFSQMLAAKKLKASGTAFNGLDNFEVLEVPYSTDTDVESVMSVSYTVEQTSPHLLFITVTDSMPQSERYHVILKNRLCAFIETKGFSVYDRTTVNMLRIESTKITHAEFKISASVNE